MITDVTFRYFQFIEVFSSSSELTGHASAALLRHAPSQQNGLGQRKTSATQGCKVYARTRQLFLWMTFVTALTFVVCWGKEDKMKYRVTV